MYKSVAVNLVSGMVNGKSCTLDTRNRVFCRLMIFWYGMQYIFVNPKDVPITLTVGVTISWPTFFVTHGKSPAPGIGKSPPGGELWVDLQLSAFSFLFF